MFKCHTKQWGNSIGIILPKRIIEEYRIRPHEDIVVEIKRKERNVLKELFGEGAEKFKKPTKNIPK